MIERALGRLIGAIIASATANWPLRNAAETDTYGADDDGRFNGQRANHSERARVHLMRTAESMARTRWFAHSSNLRRGRHISRAEFA